MRKIQHTSATNCDEFCNNGYSDFCGCDGADVEADWSEDAFQTLRRNSLGFQLLVYRKDLTARSNHANVKGGSFYSPAEDLHVMTVTSGDDDNERTFAGSQAGHDLFHFAGMNFVGVGKAFSIRIEFAIVAHDGLKAYQCRRLMN